ncbi:GNAT family N-acetyltransferase [Glutamicibacter protophormiae]|uniref:Acetyltransferase n=1 Tax=Glutamicibacter protophormiae TaxID=37930 RepID=A0ABS4XUP7_GLUPR|nr:GNAT family N-acetyltransferase [Glutamicibacter protophormiae]MBP2400241.1 putative acetyltransferase [Glutamicibacter protophormiae]GGL74128.1 acetyltransferase [Glutamicibacter protophormiae]
MTEMLVLRDWTSVEEVPELLDVWRNSAEGGRDFLSAADVDAVANALEAVYSQRVSVRIAQLGKDIVGFAAWSETRIELLWVRHHDRHQGVGSALLKDILTLCPATTIQINGQNANTLTFFLDHGFEIEKAAEQADPLARIRLRHVHISASDVSR